MLSPFRRPPARAATSLCDASFDGATWLTRARRAIAEPPRRDGSTAGWDTTLPAAMRGRDGADAAERLDALVADLSPPGSADTAAVDLALVDEVLARALSRMNALRRKRDVTGARNAGAAALSRLVALAGATGAASLSAEAGLPVDRAEHLASALGLRDPFGGGMPSGTLAHAAGSLEALAFRLARDGRLGRACAPRHPWTPPGERPPFPYGYARTSYGSAAV